MLKLIKKVPLQTKTMTLDSVDVEELIFIDTTNVDAGTFTESVARFEIEDLEERNRMVFFPFSQIERFNVGNFGKVYKLKYIIPSDDEPIVSDKAFTEEQINKLIFVSMDPEMSPSFSLLSEQLASVAPDTFTFSLISDIIKVELLEADAILTELNKEML